MTVWVDAIDGSDSNSGLSIDEPKQTLAAAWTVFQIAVSTATGDVTLYIKGHEGNQTIYNVASALSWTNINNNPSGGRVRIVAYGDGRPFITGQTEITGWTDDGDGMVSAPYTDAIRNVWLGNRGQLRRAARGHLNSSYRITDWDQATKTLTIADALAAIVTSSPGQLEMAIVMGWSISYMRVASITSIGGGLTEVAFDEPGATVEFAKGDQADPGLGTEFALGPYHNASGQRFWWENAIELCYLPGYWFHDTVTERIHMRLPTGVANAAALEAIGVYTGNGVETGIQFVGLASSTPVENVDIRGIGFERFDYTLPATDGFYIGYLSGASLYDNAGAMGYRILPAALTFYRIRSVSVEDCVFRDLGGVGVRYAGYHHFVLQENAFNRIASSAVVSGLLVTPLDTAPPQDQNRHLLISGNVATDIGTVYTGSAMFTSMFLHGVIEHNYVARCTDDGVSINTGARYFGIWNGDAMFRFNRIDEVMTMVTDGGALYTSGNMSGRVNNANAVWPGQNSIRSYGNYYTNIRTSDYDPGGGHSAVEYHDLGAINNVSVQNTVEDCDVAYLNNCSKFNTFRANKLINVEEEWLVFQSGFQVYNIATDDFTRYDPPLANPPSSDDTAKFNGTGAWAGRAFKDVQPFALVTDVIDTSGNYQPLSNISGNGPSVQTSISGVGPPAAVMSKFAEYVSPP